MHHAPQITSALIVDRLPGDAFQLSLRFRIVKSEPLAERLGTDLLWQLVKTAENASKLSRDSGPAEPVKSHRWSTSLIPSRSNSDVSCSPYSLNTERSSSVIVEHCVPWAIYRR